MKLLRTKPLAECTTPQEALSELCAGYDGAMGLSLEFEEVSPEEMPQPSRQLLVHQSHMVRTLNQHYGVPVDVHVMERHRNGNLYGRKIFLTLQESEHIVEYGVVRMDLRPMPRKVVDAIVSEHAPLGSILITHNVLRRIQPKWFLRFERRNPILDWFGCQTSGPLYGRLGTIYCNGEPTIELLEIVTAIPVPNDVKRNNAGTT
jgi:chorismate-pyruvate lyase